MTPSLSRRRFVGGLMATAALAGCKNPFRRPSGTGKIAVQLYSIDAYIRRVGIARALKEVAAIGYAGVEVAGYDAEKRAFYGASARELKRLLDEHALRLCGLHVRRSLLERQSIASICEFARTCGATTLICPGSGNMPEGISWSNHHKCRGKVLPGIADHAKRLCDFYERAADDAAKCGCRVGIHNHQWEFLLKLPDGRTFWDAFFSGTSSRVLMEQDVGWTTAAGYDPCEQYVRYPHRSPTLHAKENGYGCAGAFDAILGMPGINADGTSVKRVEWERLIPAAEADGVEWYVVECEKHGDDLSAITPSYAFLKDAYERFEDTAS